MTTYKLEIEQDSTGVWVGTSVVDSEEGKIQYLVTGQSLEELRKLVQEGLNGGLGIKGVSFDEVFLTNSQSPG